MRLEAVHKAYRRGPVVLAGVDLELTPGRPVVVLGANGSGKSSLLRIVAGCGAPTSGRVVGRPRRVGYLPADLTAPARTPAAAWLAHLAAIRGVPRASALREAADLLGHLGFTGSLDVQMTELSTGNVQKVGIVQALCGAPGLVVLDEPWSGLDDAASAVLDDLLTAASAAVLVTDHIGRAAASPGARVLRLRSGRLDPESPRPRAPAVPTRPVDGARAHPGRAPGVMVIELRCPDDPVRTAAGLPHLAQWWADGDTLRVHVPADDGDAVLAAALRAGCSVLGVRR